MNFAFIGTGKMSGAILRGILAKKLVSQNSVYVYDVNPEVASQMKRLGVSVCESVEQATQKSDVVILGVKPNVYPVLLPNIGNVTKETGALVISLAVGREIEYIENLLGYIGPVMRILPNLNAKVEASMSAFCCNDMVTNQQKNIAIEFFSAVGKVIEMDEKKMAIFSAIGSSACAYAYLFMDALATAGQKAGMDKDIALEIAAQTVLGSAKMILETKEHPGVLIDGVCSPGGTSIEGLSVLKEKGFEGTVIKAIDAVLEKVTKIKNS